jgi:hypothetical protein
MSVLLTSGMIAPMTRYTASREEIMRRQADARIRAAAPDLLAELKWIAGRIDRNSGSPNFTSDEYDRIVAAIAKADGSRET